MRDRKTGRHRNTEEESKLNLQKRRRAEERDEKFYKWGRGYGSRFIFIYYVHILNRTDYFVTN